MMWYNKTDMQKIVIGVVIAIIILGGLGFFLSKSPTQQPATTSVTPQPTVTPTPSGAMSDEKVKTITVDGTNFSFTPSTITVKQGDTVKITVKNTGGMHDFAIDEFNVKTKVISSGSSDEVQFVANKKGQFEYYCSVGQHRQMGMKGTLIVE